MILNGIKQTTYTDTYYDEDEELSGLNGRTVNHGSPSDVDTTPYTVAGTTGETKQVSVFSLIKGYYSSVKEKFTAVFDEFDWWGLAS